MNVTNARYCLLMFKTNLRWKKWPRKDIFNGISNQCERKHDTSIVYIAKNYELFI